MTGAALVKRSSTITGKRTRWAILVQGAYIVYGGKRALEQILKGETNAGKSKA